MLSIESDYPRQYGKLYRAYGQTMAQWSGIENAFSMLFARLTGMTPRVAHRVFFSGRNFATRADMLRGAVASADGHQEVVDFTKGALKRALQYSAFRNALAHGILTVVPPIGCPLDGKPIVMEAAGFDFFKDAPITIKDMQNACSNFSALELLIQMVAKWNEVDEPLAPHKCLALVRELPNPPQSQPLSRSFQEGVLPLLRFDLDPIALITDELEARRANE